PDVDSPPNPSDQFPREPTPYRWQSPHERYLTGHCVPPPWRTKWRPSNTRPENAWPRSAERRSKATDFDWIRESRLKESDSQDALSRSGRSVASEPILNSTGESRQ